MLTIGLKDVKFRAYHGVYTGEQMIGGDFILNLSVEYIPDRKEILHLEETLNYEILFKIAKDIISKPVALIEHVVMEIAHKIFISFANVEHVSIHLEKCNPPIEQLNGSVFVKYDISKKVFLQKA